MPQRQIQKRSEEKNRANITEIFSSIQGEGLYVGQKHLFVRFSGCNLGCRYCDTEFSIEKSKQYTGEELFSAISGDNSETLSLTGGEPLLQYEFIFEFLEKYKEKLNKKIYLETNGVLYKNLEKIIDLLDIIAMDIKLESATGQKNRFDENEKFLKTAKKKEVFLKIVFNSSITKQEITSCASLAREYQAPIVLQPEMPLDKKLDLAGVFEEFYSKYENIYLIPQTHKFLNLQ